MHERDTALEWFLGVGGAGDWERNFAEFFVGIVMVVVHVITERQRLEQKRSTGAG
jgi:hypothetical protein